MPRVKRAVATKKRHKRLRRATSGYYGPRSRTIRRAHEARLHALAHAQRNRRIKKRDYRTLWIARINAALRESGDVTYAEFVHQLKVKKVELDRKTLAFLADQVPSAFKDVVAFVTKPSAAAKT
ncbi:MAG: 50S ribosomal protein L20 [Candidatus Andersenbacteria bacterium]